MSEPAFADSPEPLSGRARRRAERKAKAREEYASRKANGLCTRCGDEASGSLCGPCRTRHKGSWSPAARAAYMQQYKRTKKYNLQPGEWEEIFAAQRKRCFVCLTDQPGPKGWHTDHDHQTNMVRGIACSMCNSALGFLRDDPLIAARAAKVLEATKQLRDSPPVGRLGTSEFIRKALSPLGLVSLCLVASSGADRDADPAGALSDDQIAALEPRPRLYDVCDGNGLSVRVLPSGLKSFRWRTRTFDPLTGKSPSRVVTLGRWSPVGGLGIVVARRALRDMKQRRDAGLLLAPQQTATPFGFTTEPA